jgi:hypothetical protein
MLLLEWSAAGRLARATLLAQLLQEAADILHERLTGGVLQMPLFLLPFHRDVALTEPRMAVLLHQAPSSASFPLASPSTLPPHTPQRSRADVCQV